MQKNKFTKDKTLLHEWLLKISISIFVAVVFVACFISFGGLRFFENTNYVDCYAKNPFQVHVIDVENGDAFLIKLPNGQTVMIDSGEEKYESRVISYIRQYMRYEKTNKIDYLILTHPDSDHIGNASKIIQTFEVENVYRPKIYSLNESKYISLNNNYQIDESQTYNNAIESAYKKKCNIVFTEAGKEIFFANGSLKMLSPVQDSYINDNNYSAVIMLKYNNYKMLFTGDIDSVVEKNLVNIYGEDLQADVLKVGHHGSKTSSCQEFLNAVNPKFAVLSCSDNSSILPNSETISRLKDKNIEIVSTMQFNNFVLTVDENGVTFCAEKTYFNFWALILAVLIIGEIVMFKIDFSRKNAAKKHKKA